MFVYVHSLIYILSSNVAPSPCIVGQKETWQHYILIKHHVSEKWKDKKNVFIAKYFLEEEIIEDKTIENNVHLQVVENRGPLEMEIMMHLLDMEEGDIIYNMVTRRTIFKKIPT